MRLRDIGRALHHRRPIRYPELTAECTDELSLIADRRRSDRATS